MTEKPANEPAQEILDQLRDELLALLRRIPFEPGYDHPAQEILSRTLRKPGGPQAIAQVMEDPRRPRFADDILGCLGQMDSPGDPEWRQQVLRSALQSDDPRIRDAAICAADLWQDPGTLPVLEAHQEPTGYLARQLEEMIQDLRENPRPPAPPHPLLDEVWAALEKDARKSGEELPATGTARETARILGELRACRDLQYDLHCMGDGDAAIETFGADGFGCLLIIERSGQALCIAGSPRGSRRARYQRSRMVIDDFVRQALRETARSMGREREWWEDIILNVDRNYVEAQVQHHLNQEGMEEYSDEDVDRVLHHLRCLWDTHHMTSAIDDLATTAFDLWLEERNQE